LIAVFGQVALALHDLGWRPLPCSGKAAILPRWNELCRVPWNFADLEDATAEFTDYNCGIAADREHVFLDLDVLAPDPAREITGIAERTLGSTPLIRVGLEPKAVRIYRDGSHGRIRSSKSHPIEIMAVSGMIVAFGIHPDTRQLYRWVSDASPLMLSANSVDIPQVDHLQLQQFLREAGRLLARSHYGCRDRTYGRHSAGDRSPFLGVRQRLRSESLKFGFERAAIRLLCEVHEGNRHATAFELVASAAGRGWSEDRIIRLFEAHFNGWNGVSETAFRRILDLCFRGGH
jgi:hypothetical protein